MTESELAVEIKNGTCGGLYFFYGDEDYLKNHRATALAKAVVGEDSSLASFNLIRLSFGDRALNIAEISDAMLSPPVMSPMKAVSVQISSIDSLREKERTALAELLESFSGEDYSDTVLIFSVASDGFDAGTQKKPSPFLATVSKFMKVVRFDYQSTAKLARWMERHFAEYGLVMSSGIPEMIIGICGRSMYRLSGEIAKIAAYAAAHNSPTVTAEHVEACATHTDEDDAFRLANCIIEGDTQGALAALGVKIRLREDPIFVLSQVNRAICELACASVFIVDGREKEDFARSFRMHEYKAGLYMRSAKLRSPEFFRRAVMLCLEADRTIKSSSIGYAAIERLICACAE